MRYATPYQWADYFNKTEGVTISNSTIFRRLREANKIGITARKATGRVLRNTFYSEADVLATCHDLLIDCPQADVNGFFEKDGKQFGTIAGWTNYLRKERGSKINNTTICDRLNEAKKTGITGRDRIGRIHTYYSEADVRAACHDLLIDCPQADRSGFFVVRDSDEPSLRARASEPRADSGREKDGERYGTTTGWKKYFRKKEGITVDSSSIENRLNKAQKKGVTGRDRLGRVLKNAFYSESDVHEACGELLEDIPIAKEGFFELNGVRYGTHYTWGPVLNIAPTSIKKYLQRAKATFVKGRISRGTVHRFYSEDTVRSVCADLLIVLPQADESGFFEKDGVRYGTRKAIARSFRIGKEMLSRRIKNASIQSIKGRDITGGVWDFYPLTEACGASADVLNNDLPQVNKKGFFEKDGVRYGTSNTWARIILMSSCTVRNRFKKFNIRHISGKDSSNNVANLYSEADFMAVFVDELEHLPQADESGCFEKDGEKYGTFAAWSRLLSISYSFIRSRVGSSDTPFISGRARNNVQHNFYSESDVHHACRDLLAKRSNPHAA